MVLILRRGLTLAAIELKGGKSIDMRHAIDQIQNGLTTAIEILEERAIRSWVPLLFYSGSLGFLDLKLLNVQRVWLRGTRKNVVKVPCGSRLLDILDEQSSR